MNIDPKFIELTASRWRPENKHIPIVYIYSCDHSFFRGFGHEFFVSASVCDSRNWNPRSNSFVRAPSSGGDSNANHPAVSVPHLDVNADRRWARQARSALFCTLSGIIRPSYSWTLAYAELERINKGQHFQIGVISKLASKFLPDDAFSMAASNRLPCSSCYCYVSFPFGSVDIVLYNQQRMCREYDSHPDHIYLVFRSVRTGDVMNGYDSC